ncbi:MAG: hypothetical protein KDA85_06890, partial [Planctomycetaceae bacterium]|nr:hypothetical protein [Planctomycetaceae bacterium]
FAAAPASCGPHWAAVKELLATAGTPHPLADRLLIAAFGTPVRYGWDSTGCKRLIHILHHRQPSDDSPWTTHPLFPPHAMKDVVNATWGDWVQAFAIAGTDVSTIPTRDSNGRFMELLERNLTSPEPSLDTRLIRPATMRDLCIRWKTGTRCHTDGLNLLLNYEPSGDTSPLGRPLETSLLGHGVATTCRWLPVHLKLIIEGLADTSTA